MAERKRQAALDKLDAGRPRPTSGAAEAADPLYSCLVGKADVGLPPDPGGGCSDGDLLQSAAAKTS